MSLSLDHIQIAMPGGGEDKARAFWCGLLGLEELEKPAALRSRGGLWLSLGAQQLHLGNETPFHPAKKAHPGLIAPDIDGTTQTLAAAGHPITWDDNIPNRKRFFTEDPFGNRLEFLAA